MSNLEKGISAISKEIDETIKKEIDSILEEANKVKSQILGETNEKVQREIQKIENETNKIIENEKNRINSLIRLETRRNMYILKDKLINQVLEKVNEKLIDFTKTEQYFNLLNSFLKKGIQETVDLIRKNNPNFNITLIIASNEKDRNKISKKLLDELENKFKIKVELSNSIQTIGGVKIYTQDNSILYDNTFEARMERKRTEIRIKIASILYGEEG